MKIKAVYKKNLKMTSGKIASQIAHAVKNLGDTPVDCDIAVIMASTKKFNEYKEKYKCYVQIDKGKTEVETGEETALAFIEEI